MTFKRRSLGFSTLLVMAGFTIAPGCTSDDDDTNNNAGATCTGAGGPVDGPADTHCIDDAGKQITQAIGTCNGDSTGTAGSDGGGGATGSDGAGGAAGHGGHDHEHAAAAGDEGGDEAYTVRFGSEAADDDCKYDTSFMNSCIEVNKPVTLTFTLRQRATGNPGSGGHPDSPEIYLADKPSHISPSNTIKATEGPLGTYAIGPIVFDVAGRWVVRFHFFETCSDIPPDSPHGHVAFYVDVL